MNMPSNAVLEIDQSVRSQAAISPARPIFWSIQRELWEHRYIYIAPLGVAALFLFGFLISVFRLPARLRGLPLDPMKLGEQIQRPYNTVALLIMFTTFLIAIFYSLEALQGERRDRSILFWKSLPVSDLTTVLSKASIPIVLLPLLTFAVTAVTQGIMLLLSTVVVGASGLKVSTLWDQLPLSKMWAMLLYHLLAIHGLWYAPIYGWLLLVSAWARRAAFLWAILPLLAIGFAEKIAFGSSHLAALFAHRISGGSAGDFAMTSSMNMDHIGHGHNALLFVSPGLWIGLAVTAAFIVAAARIRRNRGPM
jgi:ABC-2 type transport system permease protein